MRVVICLILLSALVAFIAVPAMTAEDASRKIIKQGLVGAATGAVASEVSGGKAGKGALVGAGTNIIGGALVDVLLPEQTPAAPEGAKFQDGYTQGYQDGYQSGYQAGLKAAGK